MHILEKFQQRTDGKCRREVEEEQFRRSIFYNNDDSDCIGVLWPLIRILTPQKEDDSDDEE